MTSKEARKLIRSADRIYVSVAGRHDVEEMLISKAQALRFTKDVCFDEMFEIRGFGDNAVIIDSDSSPHFI